MTNFKDLETSCNDGRDLTANGPRSIHWVSIRFFIVYLKKLSVGHHERVAFGRSDRKSVSFIHFSDDYFCSSVTVWFEQCMIYFVLGSVGRHAMIFI